MQTRFKLTRHLTSHSRETVRRLTPVATAVRFAGFFNRIRHVSAISRSKCLRTLRMRITASSVSSRTTRARAVAVIPRTAAEPTRAAAAAVTPWAAATVPRAERRTRGAMSVGSDPAREPWQRAPAKPGEKRRTSVGLLGSKRRHVRLRDWNPPSDQKKGATPDTRAKNHCRTCSPPIQIPINPILHRMEMRFFFAGYEHHQPPTTTAHALQRPRMPFTYPRSTYDTHFVAKPRRVTACSVTSGHLIAENAVYYNGGMQ